MTPTTTIPQQPWMADPDLQAVFAALQGDGDPVPSVLCVGGCVRDVLMDRPVVDVDLATIHPPDITMARLAAAGIDVLEIGIEHGTVVARFGHKLFQITTLRVDVETDGRHAQVAYTDDWTADASRRDFTMNALYADLDGNVFDPLGGMADVEARRVRLSAIRTNASRRTPCGFCASSVFTHSLTSSPTTRMGFRPAMHISILSRTCRGSASVRSCSRF